MWIQSAVFTILLGVVYSKSMRRLMSEYNESSSNITSNCNCDWRLLRHYEAKLCQPVQEDECGCPIKYNCPSMNEIENIQKDCIFKGKKYEVGSKINTTNDCQVCKCLGRKKPRIFCIPMECPFVELEDNRNCYPIYEKNGCCPARFECGLLRTNEESVEEEFTCEYESQHFPLGAMIYPDSDPCQICQCTVDWYDMNLRRCHQQECILEKNKAQLDAGCVPIYHESRCCPIEFYCPQNEDYNNTPEFASGNTSDVDSASLGSRCVFGSNFYDIGQELPINHTTNCITCTCLIPPDFTCIHQSCPQPPSEENCITTFSPNECCPHYECLLADSNVASSHIDSELEKRDMKEAMNGENPCFDLKCEEDRKCMLYLVMCGSESCPPVPTCLKINNECQTPTCEEGCVVVEQDENNCLTCACGENINRSVSTLKCQMPHCVGQNCRLIGEGGCPTCTCDEPCAINECPPGCNVLLTEAEGRCPQCVCEDETEGCPTPICQDETCRIESPDGGCPTCICDANAASSTDQVQYQQKHVGDSEREGQIQRESEEDFDDIQIMTGNAPNVDNQPDNALNSEVEKEYDGIPVFASPLAGGRQP